MDNNRPGLGAAYRGMWPFCTKLKFYDIKR